LFCETYESGEDPVDPELGLAEEDVVQPPDGVEAVGRRRFSQHAVEVQLKKRKYREKKEASNRQKKTEKEQYCWVFNATFK
jgi:hypothetical protein